MTLRPSELDALSAEVLTPVVERCLGTRAVVQRWAWDTFGHAAADGGATPTVVRVTGEAVADGERRAWSVVLKGVPPSAEGLAPTAPAWMSREPCLYEAGLLAGLRGVSAVRSYGAALRADGGWWVWLEEVRDDIGRTWPPARYALAARHLATFNVARGATQEALRDIPWLSRSPLPGAFAQFEPGVRQVLEARRDAVVATAIPVEAAEALLRLCERIPQWLSAMDTLPQELAHWDAHRANLLSTTDQDGHARTVALDWAGLGRGPAGADLSHLLSQTVNFFGLDTATLPALDAALWAAYLDGLGEAGWRGDSNHVRFAYTTASAVRLVVRVATALRVAGDAATRESFARAAGQPFDVLALRFGRALSHYLSLAAEADRLFLAL